MASSSADNEPPKSMANVTPTQMDGVSGQTRILIDTLKDQLRDVKDDIKSVKTDLGKLRDDRHTELKWIIGAAVVILGTLVTAYFKLDSKVDVFSNRLDDKIVESVKTSTRIETKLDDLISRVPPVQTPLKSSP